MDSINEKKKWVKPKIKKLSINYDTNYADSPTNPDGGFLAGS
jgi:hypothetical protein